MGKVYSSALISFLALYVGVAAANTRCIEEVQLFGSGKANSPHAILVSNYGIPLKNACGAQVAAVTPKPVEKVVENPAPIATPVPAVVSENPKAKAKSVEFSLSSWSISKEAQSELRALADKIKASQPKAVVLSGFADKTGPAKLNQSLSEKRAAAVLKVLAKSGVPAKLVKAKGYGSKPDDASRRVDIKVE